MSRFELLFERAILDKAQYVRYKDSAYWHLANLLLIRYMHLVSAMPTLNHVCDIKGHYLLLIRVSGVQEVFDIPDDPDDRDRLDKVIAESYDAAAVKYVAFDNKKRKGSSVWETKSASEREP
ncbi:hypothetical protein DL764_007464 [Monosporascus ibericus]|uniref:Uncharacterized protein n=1 Tax=Monosporascus ibericus TaxID=155417 RepID=A0A4V1X9L2_9PEZI|nr:hypothetical protein DL764_007464 [Monosporascus ibericus]